MRVRARACVCVCVCVCTITQNEIDLGRRMKFKYIVVDENNSDKFHIGHYPIKVKVAVGLQKFPHLPQYKLSGPITQLWHKLERLY